MFDSRQNLATAFAQLGPLAEDAATRAKPHGLSQQVLGPDHPEYAEQPPQQLAFAAGTPVDLSRRCPSWSKSSPPVSGSPNKLSIVLTLTASSRATSRLLASRCARAATATLLTRQVSQVAIVPPSASWYRTPALPLVAFQVWTCTGTGSATR